MSFISFFHSLLTRLPKYFRHCSMTTLPHILPSHSILRSSIAPSLSPEEPPPPWLGGSTTPARRVSRPWHSSWLARSPAPPPTFSCPECSHPPSSLMLLLLRMMKVVAVRDSLRWRGSRRWVVEANAAEGSSIWSYGERRWNGGRILSSVLRKNAAGHARRCAVGMVGHACAIAGSSVGIGRLVDRNSVRWVDAMVYKFDRYSRAESWWLLSNPLTIQFSGGF